MCIRDSLPSSALAVPPEVRPDYQIILNLEPSGTIKFQGQAYESSDALGTVFRQEINSANREGVNNPGDIAVIIRSHEDTPTGKVQKLISECQKSELQSFSLRVNEQVYRN